MEDILLKEFYEWKQLLSYPEWQNYVHLLNEHCRFLQKEVNRCVREGNKDGAIAFLAQKDLIPRLLGKVKEKINILKKGGE